MLIYGRFTTVEIQDGGATIYRLSNVGQVAWGVKCVNSGEVDFMLFDTREEANEYIEFVSTM